MRSTVIAALLLSALAGTCAASDVPALGWWYGFRNSYQNRGVSAVAIRREARKASGRTPWQVRTKGLIWGTPVVDVDGGIYVGSADKVFYALTPQGQVR